METVKLTISENDQGRTIEAVLKERYSMSRSLIRKIKREGQVYLNGNPVFLIERVGKGDILVVVINSEKGSDILPEEIPLKIIYEDEDVIAVDKPPGMIVHPVRGERENTLANAVIGYWLKKGKRNPVYRPVYRIDRDTSGIVLVAGTRMAHLSLDLQLRERIMKRKYIAIAGGLVFNNYGVINEPIGRKKGSIVEREVTGSGSVSVTHYSVIKRLPDIEATVLEVVLETGRTHQIRVHMSHIGHPLLGDTLYGGNRDLIKRQALHSHRAEFNHPKTGERIVLKSDLPEDMKKLAF
ncbi:MAG: RluA family pseudouridine synthase [Bacillota bacterium]